MKSIARRIAAGLLAGVVLTVPMLSSAAPAAAAEVDDICDYAPWWPGCY